MAITKGHATCNAMFVALQVAREIASCNIALSHKIMDFFPLPSDYDGKRKVLEVVLFGIAP